MWSPCNSRVHKRGFSKGRFSNNNNNDNNDNNNNNNDHNSNNDNNNNDDNNDNNDNNNNDNNDITTTHESLNPPLLNPPFVNSRCTVDFRNFIVCFCAETLAH